MKKTLSFLLFAAALAMPVQATAQRAWSLREATYITKEQIDQVNTLPGVDRQIVSRNIGDLNLSVGIIHRGALNPAAGRGGGPVRAL